MDSFVGTVHGGVIRVDDDHPLPEGQRVLVLVLDKTTDDDEVPPQELLDEDARDLSPSRDALASVNAKGLG